MVTLIVVSMFVSALGSQPLEYSWTRHAGADKVSISAEAVLVVDEVVGNVHVKYWEHVINDIIHLKSDYILLHTSVGSDEVVEYQKNWRDIELADVEIKPFEPRKEYFWRKLVAFSSKEDCGYFYTLDDTCEYPFVCWEIRHVDGTTLMYDLEGSEVGFGRPAPSNGFSLSGYNNASWPDPWISYRQDADSWFNKWCDTSPSVSLPTPGTISNYVSDPEYEYFFELAHGSSYLFQADSTDSYYNSSTVATDMAFRPSMRFAFIGSCEGMTYTGPGTFSHEFRKGSVIDTTTVGYSGMASCPGWSVSLQWQDYMFQKMDEGYTIKSSFDMASAQYPTIASCVRFVGDPTTKVLSPESAAVYIRSDGSIDPPTAPIQRNGDVYTLTGDIICDANGILIERNNLTLDGAGYTLQGPAEAGQAGSTNGTYLTGRMNITVTNLHVNNFENGVMLDESSNCTLLDNIIENNHYGIWLASSHNNSIHGNQLVGNAIVFWPSSDDNRLTENNIVNDYQGISIYNPRGIVIHNNTITNSSYGISLYYGFNNTIDDNTLLNAGLRVHGTYENIVENNTVNGKPLVYLEKASDYVVEDAGQVILVNCSNITVKNLNLSYTSYPIQLWETNNSRIANSSVTASNWNGIQLFFSSNNTLERNNITGDLYHAIHFYSSSNNTLRNNLLSVDRYFNFFVDGLDLQHFTHDVDTSNTLNGKPIYYWIDKTEMTVPEDAGYVALVNCTDITIQNLDLAKNAQAILLAFTTNSTITQNNFTANEYDVFLHRSSNNSITKNDMTEDWYGVWLQESSDNLVQENTIKQTNYYGIYAYLSSQNRILKNTIAAWYGVWFESSSGNLVYHNDFGGTTSHQFFTRDSVNIWDDGYPSGGNHWPNYNGTDIYNGSYQNETGSDGIGDAPYVIDASNQDNYPLVIHDTALTNIHTMKTNCLPLPTVCQNMTTGVYVTVENQGEYAETFNVTAYANSTLIGIQNATLNVGESTVLTFSWNTTGLPEYCFYTISANTTLLPYETNLTDNSLVGDNITITHLGDITGDGKVDVQDLARVSGAFGTVRISDPQDPHYNQYWHPIACPHCPHSPNADINCDSKVDIQDLARTSAEFGWHR